MSWYNSNQLTAPLFLMSLAPPINKQAFDNISSKDFSVEKISNLDLWELIGTRRVIESGFVLRAMIAKEGEHFIENIKLLCINDWKMTNYKVCIYVELFIILYNTCIITYKYLNIVFILCYDYFVVS